jgi:hypothetical protein
VPIDDSKRSKKRKLPPARIELHGAGILVKKQKTPLTVAATEESGKEEEAADAEEVADEESADEESA